MTTPRPTPGLMPRRDPARPTASASDRQLLAPATIPGGRSLRSLWEETVLASNMPTNARFVGIALATHADAGGQIAQQPRLLGLQHETGLHAKQIAVALTVLRDRRFIRQTRPTDRYETADFYLTVPKAVMARHLRRSALTERPTTDA
ncbi:hypothetical protein IFE09_11155 [Streptomyces microflavus]|uniref:hypothetical protein n=1 Tax=Streptomyces microflavus TaxID=1919 RepID=UPI00192C6EC6|nr:hypothetical protein [Streptomyces microflavus]QQZ54115.1 hypothetical protein IFE09_11155 [Streptomyces microflavus]